MNGRTEQGGSSGGARRIFAAHAPHLRRWLLRCSVTPWTALPALLGAATGSGAPGRQISRRSPSLEPLRTTATICAVGALLAVAAGLATGHWRGGVGVAIGLLVGAANGFLARRALGIEANFGFTAMGRLALLSAIGLALGLLLGLAYVPLVLLGIAGAQLVLAVIASVTAVRTS